MAKVVEHLLRIQTPVLPKNKQTKKKKTRKGKNKGHVRR
jgi:hypothetical protein